MNDKVKEAQEAWDDLAEKKMNDRFSAYSYKNGISDFKQALKRDLEKELTSCPSKTGVHYNNGILEALRKIETCKP